MHSICVDKHNTLTIKIDPIDDETVRYYIKEYLETAKCKQKEDGAYTYTNSEDIIKFRKRTKEIVGFFTKTFENNLDICDKVNKIITSIHSNTEFFNKAMEKGAEIKEKNNHEPQVGSQFCRQLMDYQKKSVEHMIVVGNTANFSVPGSGKTTITYAAISRWIEDGIIEKIMVIGPTASFLPWEEEYEICFGKKPKSCRVSSQIASVFYDLDESYDLFLMHFNTAMNRHMEIQKFMDKWKTVLIIDESHYIKSPEMKRWAHTAIRIAPMAKRRIALSGTPMPNNAKDLWTQITFLWPQNFPLGNQASYNMYAKKHGIGKHRDTLNKLFCRIKKNDLCLPDPKWDICQVPLNCKQQNIYNAIAAKTLKDLTDLNIHDQSKLQKFRIAKMIRLLQAASNPSLLNEKSDRYYLDGDRFAEAFGVDKDNNLKLPIVDDSIIKQITEYSRYEIPSKIVKTARLAEKLVNEGNKVIIWSTFIDNMDLLKNNILKRFDPIVINGNVLRDPNIKENRDNLINKFKDGDSSILIASPASLAESVSLHKNQRGDNVCNHAIYLDRNFNGAQYMQSMDRIHRIGMDESVTAQYHLIVAENTIDEVINHRLNTKWKDMLNALNDDMLKSLNINPPPKPINEYEMAEDYQKTVEHLKKIYE